MATKYDSKDKKTKRYRSFIKDAEKLTGKNLNITVGGKSSNHRKGALDIGKNTNKLSNKEMDKIGVLARSHGLRAGMEGNHVHVDDNFIQRGKLQPSVFTRTSPFKTEGASSDHPVVKAHKKEIGARGKYLFGLPKEEEQAPTRDVSTIKGLGGNPYTDNDLFVDDLTSLEVKSNELKKEREEYVTRTKTLATALSTGQGQEIAQTAVKNAVEIVIEKMQNPTSLADLRRDSRDIVKHAEGLGANFGPILDSRKGKEQQNNESVSNNFLEALSFFLPTALGALVGGAIEGTEGAVAGAETATSLGASFRDHQLKKEQMQLKREELELKKNKPAKPKDMKIDITPEFMSKENKKPLFTRETPSGVEFFDAEGNVYSSDQVVSMKIDQGSKREQRLEAQSKRNFTQKQTEEGIKAIDKFKASNKGDIDQLRNLKMAQTLLDGKQLSSDQLATFNAKTVFGEARITDEDVERAQIPKTLLQEIKDAPEQALSGKLGPEGTKNAQKLLSILINKKSKLLKKSAKNNATKFRARAAGLSDKELENEFLLAVDINKSDKEERKFSREEIDAMKAKLRAKRGGN